MFQQLDHDLLRSQSGTASYRWYQMVYDKVSNTEVNERTKLQDLLLIADRRLLVVVVDFIDRNEKSEQREQENNTAVKFHKYSKHI